uniref:Uncharacterized protein n=1 Tax=Glossina pallidipes TaxID=7398 RepID=A0A1A9Z9H6_GLOPL
MDTMRMGFTTTSFFIAIKCGLDRAHFENANDRATELKRIHNDIAITDNDASLVAKIDTCSANRDEIGEVEWGASCGQASNKRFVTTCSLECLLYKCPKYGDDQVFLMNE